MGIDYNEITLSYCLPNPCLEHLFLGVSCLFSKATLCVTRYVKVGFSGVHSLLPIGCQFRSSLRKI